MIPSLTIAGCRLPVAGCLLFFSGCSPNPPVLRPYIEVPAPGTEAYPYGQLDEIELSVTRAGDDTPLVAATFAPGQAMSLSDVPFGDDLVVRMRGRMAGFELAHGKTCPIDLSADGTPDEPHLWFANIVHWALGPALDADPVRVGASSYLLADGSAIFVGGGDTVDTVVRFDPLAGAFARLENTVAARRGAAVVPFGDDRALIVGGVDAGGTPVSFIEVLSPLAARAQQVQTQQDGPRVFDHIGVTLPAGEVLVAGGRHQPTTDVDPAVTDVAWRFRLGASGLVDDPALAELPVRLRHARAGHAATRLEEELGAVLLTGGEDATGMPVAAAELYLPASQTFEEIAATLQVPRWGHRAVRLPGGFVVVVGGLTRAAPGAPATPVAEVEVYDPIRVRFEIAGTLAGTEAGLTDHTLTLLPDGRALLTGGTSAAGAPVASAFIVDLRLNGSTVVLRLLDTDHLGATRAGHAAAALCDGTILIVGGAASGVWPTERYTPL